jgi:hypothetical protein
MASKENNSEHKDREIKDIEIKIDNDLNTVISELNNLDLSSNGESKFDRFRCDECGCVNKDATELMDHKMIWHEKIFDDITIYECACRRMFQDEILYNNHMEECQINNNRSQNQENKLVREEGINQEEKKVELKNINLIPPAPPRLVRSPRVPYRNLIPREEKKNNNSGDNIPTHIYGRHVCPVCQNKYYTQFDLGEHFTLSHSNYESQLILDSKKAEGGFPGLDLLVDINMISYVEDKETFMKLMNEQCHICTSDLINNKEVLIRREYNKKKRYIPEHRKNKLDPKDSFIKYKVYKPKYKLEKKKKDYKEDDEDQEKIIEKLLPDCYSDSEELYYKKKNKTKKVNITDPILQNVILWNSVYKKNFVKLNCCNVYICVTCLTKYIKEKNDITCLFCKFDHNKRDLDYIRYHEVGTCNKKIWIKWWQNHYEILEKNIFK